MKVTILNEFENGKELITSVRVVYQNQIRNYTPKYCEELYSLIYEVNETQSEESFNKLMDFLNPYKKEVIDKLEKINNKLANFQSMLSDDIDTVQQNLAYKLGKDYSVEIIKDKLQCRKVGTYTYMPDILVEELYSNKNYKKYLKFWDRCLSNNIPNIRQQVFNWLKSHGLTITNEGFIIGYRNAVDITYILNELIEERLRKGKKLSNRILIYNLDYHYHCKEAYKIKKMSYQPKFNEVICVTNIDTNPYVFTHAHGTTGYRKFFTLEDVYVEDIVDINPNNECSKGLHVGNIKFSIHSFGDVSLACLICPSKIVAVPTHDCNKLRASELYPYDIITDIQNYHENLDDVIMDFDYVTELNDYVERDVEYVICESNKQLTLKQYQEEKEELERKLETRNIDVLEILNNKNG